MSAPLPGRALVVAAFLTVCYANGVADTIDGPREAVPQSLNKVVSISKIIFAGTVEQVKRGWDQRTGEITRVTFKDVDFVKGAKSGRAILTLPVNRDATVLVRKGGMILSTPPRPVTKAEAAGSFLSGLPVFLQGSRYVVLAAEWGNPQDGFLPIPLEEGLFIVREGAIGSYVLDSENRPVLGIKDGCLGVVDSSFGAITHSENRVRAVDGSVISVAESWEVDYPDTVFTKPHVVLGKDSLPALWIYPTRADTGERLSEAAFLDALRRLKMEN